MKCVNNHPEQTVNILDLTRTIAPYNSPMGIVVGDDVSASRFLFHAIRRRKFLLWLGGFRIYERRVPIVRKANKSENNDARMKINKPYLTMITC